MRTRTVSAGEQQISEFNLRNTAQLTVHYCVCVISLFFIFSFNYSLVLIIIVLLLVYRDITCPTVNTEHVVMCGAFLSASR